MKSNQQAANSPDLHFLDAESKAALGDPAVKRAQPGELSGRKEGVSPALSGLKPGKQKRQALKQFIVILLGLSILAGAGWITYQAFNQTQEKSENSGAPPPVVTVTTVKATMRPVDEILSVTGSVSAWDELKVGVEVGGLRVKDVYVEEGDRVKKGQILAEMNSGLLQAQLAQAKARLKSGEANLVKSVQPNRPEDIEALKSAYSQAENNILQEEAHRDQAKVGLESAEINVPRYEGLAKIGAVSLVEAETKRFARDNAKLELASAEQKLAAARRGAEQSRQKLLLALHGGRSEDVLMMRAAVEEIKAQIKHLSEQIDQTVVRAPDDGVILRRDVHIGDTSEMSKPFFTMSRQGRLELKAQVNDTDLQKFKPGQPVTISADEKKGNIVGTVRLVSPQVDSASRMGMARIDLPGGAGLKPGMFVRGEVRLTRHKGLTVPVNCVVTRGGESFVFTLDGERAVSTTVTTGMQTDEFIEIKKGLSEGDLVVDKGARFLSDRDVVDFSN